MCITMWWVGVFSQVGYLFFFSMQLPVSCHKNMLRSSSFHLLPGFFSVQNVVPQPDGDSSKVKVKVRVNIHGIFSVSGASLIEKQKGEGEDMQTDTEPVVQNESRAEEQVGLLLPQSLL